MSEKSELGMMGTSPEHERAVLGMKNREGGRLLYHLPKICEFS